MEAWDFQPNQSANDSKVGTWLGINLLWYLEAFQNNKPFWLSRYLTYLEMSWKTKWKSLIISLSGFRSSLLPGRTISLCSKTANQRKFLLLSTLFPNGPFTTNRSLTYRLAKSVNFMDIQKLAARPWLFRITILFFREIEFARKWIVYSHNLELQFTWFLLAFHLSGVWIDLGKQHDWWTPPIPRVKSIG